MSHCLKEVKLMGSSASCHINVLKCILVSCAFVYRMVLDVNTGKLTKIQFSW